MTDRTGVPGAIDRSVGARIRAQRERMGLSPQDLAAQLGCEPGLILGYESGRIRAGATVLMMLAGLYQVDIGYFLSGLDSGGAQPPLDRPVA